MSEYDYRMKELAELKQLAKKLASAVGAVTSAADGWTRTGSMASMAWWTRKVGELREVEAELGELLAVRAQNPKDPTDVTE